jgi:hypothetical protein
VCCTTVRLPRGVNMNEATVPPALFGQRGWRA